MNFKKIETYEEIYDAFNKLKRNFFAFGGNLEQYCKKICDNGICYVCVEEVIVAIVAFYANDTISKTAYITSVMVEEKFRGRGLATSLIKCVEDYCRKIDFQSIRLEVKKDNLRAIKLYQKNGFVVSEVVNESVYMTKLLN